MEINKLPILLFTLSSVVSELYNCYCLMTLSNICFMYCVYMKIITDIDEVYDELYIQYKQLRSMEYSMKKF